MNLGQGYNLIYSRNTENSESQKLKSLQTSQHMVSLNYTVCSGYKNFYDSLYAELTNHNGRKKKNKNLIKKDSPEHM